MNLKYLDKAHGFYSNTINYIQQDKNGIIWFATENNGLIKYENNDFHFLNTDQGLSSNKASAVFCDQQGLVWVGIRWA